MIELPSAYAGCTLKLVVGVAIFEPIVCLEVAGTERSQSTPTAAVGQPSPRVESQLPDAVAN